MSGSASKNSNILYLYRFGSAEFDQARFELRIEGQTVDADRRPLELLNLLLEHLGEVLTRDELYETLWQDEDVGEGAIANAVSRLRRHLGKENAAFIVTRPRVGYSFTGKVERIAQSTPTESAVALNVGDPVPGRPDYRLDQLLSVSGNKKREVWLAVSVTNALPHVFKFTLDADGLRQLKREYTLSELLSRAPSTSDTVTRVCGRNFEQPPFFVEYPYAGEDLLNWSEKNDNLCNLSREARLELFLHIADTVSAAHDLGVLHKDIKPANILMSESQNGITPLLTDFGSSHLIQKDILSEHGVSPLGMSVSFDALPSSAGGTLMYLAPEVWAGGSPGIRSDVYALGIMLYQMVIGDLRQGIPSDWRERLGDELLADDIQQATSSDPEERLKSVGELTSRLRNLEERRQVAEEQARKEEDIRLTREALNRSQARRPWLIAASLTLVVGMATSLLLYKNALTAQQEAERQTARAEAINEFWQEEIIQGGNPYAKDQASITDILVSASDRVGEAFKDDPVTAGSIYASLSSAFSGISEFHYEMETAEQAYRNMEEAYGVNSVEAWTGKLKYALTLSFNGRTDEADKLLKSFEDIQATRLINTPELEYRRLRVISNLEANKQNWERTIALNSRILELVEDNKLPDGYIINPSIALSEHMSKLKRYEEANEIIDGLLSDFQDLSQPRILFLRLTKASNLSNMEDNTAALPLLIDLEPEILAAFGESSKEYLSVLNRLSNIFSDNDDWPKALEYSEKALLTARTVLPEDSFNLIALQAAYGIQLQNSGYSQQAIKELSQVKQRFLDQFGPESLYLHAFSYTLSLAYTNLDMLDEARNQFNQIDIDKLQKTQPKVDVAERVKILQSVLDYREFGDISVRESILRSKEILSDCSCALLTLVTSTLQESERQTLAEGSD